MDSVILKRVILKRVAETGGMAYKQTIMSKEICG